MNNAYILQLLNEMKENCYKDGKYLDPKRMSKAEALNYAIFLVEKENESSVRAGIKDKEFFEIVENYMKNQGDNTQLIADNKGARLTVSTPLQSKQSAFHEMSLAIKEYLKYCDIPTLIVADEQEVKAVSIVQTHDLA